MDSSQTILGFPAIVPNRDIFETILTMRFYSRVMRVAFWVVSNIFQVGIAITAIYRTQAHKSHPLEPCCHRDLWVNLTCYHLHAVTEFHPSRCVGSLVVLILTGFTLRGIKAFSRLTKDSV